MLTSDLPRTRSRPRRDWLLFLGALLCIFGANLAVIDRYGSDLPLQDAWGKEAAFVLAPLLEGDSPWIAGALLPHNEHRIYFTLATNVGLALISGQWDQRQQCVVNALLHGVVMGALASFAWRRLPAKWGAIVALLCVALAALPLVWNNMVWGFQSQYHFLIGFTLLAIYGLLRAPFSRWWWIGAAAAVAAVFAMGSGFFAAAAVAVILLRDVERWRHHLPTFACTAAVLSLGLFLHTTVPWHAPLRATSASQLLSYAAHAFAWPLPAAPLFALLLYLPLALLAVRWIRGGAAGEGSAHTVRFTVALGLWVVMQIVALSYSRGAEAGMPANRYGDVFIIGIVANALALGLFRSRSKPWIVWTGCWLAAVTFGGAAQLRTAFEADLPRHANEVQAYVDTLRAYVRDGNAAALAERPVPLAHRGWLKQILDRPVIRAVLPPSVSNPARISPLSAFAEQLARAGWLFAAAGVVALVLAIWNQGTGNRGEERYGEPRCD